MKMKCPKCGEETNHLEGYEEYRFTLQLYDVAGKNPCLGETENRLCEDSFRAECPHCNELLFMTRKEVEKFLKEK